MLLKSSGQKRIVLSTKPPKTRDSYLTALLHDANNKLAGLMCLSELGDEPSDNELQNNAFVMVINDMRKRCRDVMKKLMSGAAGPDDLIDPMIMLRNRSRVIRSLLRGLDIDLKEIALDHETFMESLDEFNELIDRGLRHLEYQDELEYVEYKDISSEVRSVVQLFRQRYPRVSFSLDLEERCLTAYEPGTIRRLLENLLMNAVQSLESQTGEVRIRLSQRCLDDTSLPSENIKQGVYIGIDIEDNGSGISPEIMEQLRDSAVTTKTEGFGVGLQSARQSVVRHKGHLIIESDFGKGTKVTTLIPSTLPPPPRLPKIDGFGNNDPRKD